MKWNSNVTAVVDVTVKEIPEEAVLQSGSIRFVGKTKEEFIKPDPATVSIFFISPTIFFVLLVDEN